MRTKFSTYTDSELLQFKDHITVFESPLLYELFLRLEKKVALEQRLAEWELDPEGEAT